MTKDDGFYMMNGKLVVAHKGSKVSMPIEDWHRLGMWSIHHADAFALRAAGRPLFGIKPERILKETE